MAQSIELERLPSKTALESHSHTVRHVAHQKSDSEPATSQDREDMPSADSDVPFVQTRAQEIKAYVQMISLSWAMFVVGWNDGTTGPLLPKIQSIYNVSDTLVSLVFIFACVGFVSGACLNVFVSERLGFGKLVVLGSALPVVGYVLQSAALPFPVFIMAYTINGVGIAVLDAQVNTFAASLKKRAETKMGLLHAIYGVGAFAAPLVSTQFSQLERWSLYFLISLGLAIINVALLLATFKLKSQDACLQDIGQPLGEKGHEGTSYGSFRQILSNRNVHFMAFFLLIYVGVEVTIGGWIVTFIIRERNGGPDAGYISSGFFGGLALGRVALLWFNALVGERYVVFIYAALAIGLEFIVWFVPSLIGGAIAVSIVGFLLGPMYPITMNHAGRTIPRFILAGSIGWIAGFGQAGSAVFPFMTGALAGKFGITSLQPVLIAMMGAMSMLWGVIVVGGRKRNLA
ncbi:hypothetical protein PQX77_016858 [Marasmius sp. AFHP31]|nr:hypothetical protein PQX77_016858 [Marasmius sp. AFHP31]